MNKNIFFDRLFDIAFSMLIGVFSAFVLSSIGFIFHICINTFYPILAVIISLCSLLFLSHKKNLDIKNTILNFFIFFAVLLITYFVAICKFDSSWDGREYHQLGIILLGNGYNPIFDSINIFADKFFNDTVESLIWVETYPKFVEIVATNIFMITKQIESGKMLNYILMFIAFSYSFYILNKERFSNINFPFKFVISLAIVINPIVIAQMFTYYVDFVTYLFFVFLMLAIVDLEIKPNNKALFIYAISSVCLMNVKWSGILFYFVPTFLYLAYLLINKEKKISLKFGITNIVVLILTALTLINPIYTNIKNYDNPLYPVYGKDKMDFMTLNTPYEFINQNRAKSLFLSTFCEISNVSARYANKATLKFKIPFSVHQSELKPISTFDIRVGGFGVLWGGIVLLAFALLFFMKFNDEKDKKICLLFFIILILLTVLNTYPWWARYVPHLWLFPIIVSVFVLNRNKKNKFALILVCILYISIIANFMIQYSCVSEEERLYRQDVNDFMQERFQNPTQIEVFGTYDKSLLQKFKEYNIKYELVSYDYYSKNKALFKPIHCSLARIMQYKLKENQK